MAPRRRSTLDLTGGTDFVTVSAQPAGTGSGGTPTMSHHQIDTGPHDTDGYV